MELRRAAFICTLSAAVVAYLLVPDATPDIGVLVGVFGAGDAATILTGYGGQYLFLCLCEAFAVSLGTVSPVLGVLFQPAIAMMLCNDNWASLIVVGSATILAAAGALIFRQPLFLLLALLVVSTCLAVGLMGFDTWMRRRLSSGDAA